MTPQIPLRIQHNPNIEMTCNQLIIQLIPWYDGGSQNRLFWTSKPVCRWRAGGWVRFPCTSAIYYWNHYVLSSFIRAIKVPALFNCMTFFSNMAFLTDVSTFAYFFLQIPGGRDRLLSVPSGCHAHIDWLIVSTSYAWFRRIAPSCVVVIT